MAAKSAIRNPNSGHIPVLFQETLAALAIHPGGTYVDGTVGQGGHAAGILERSSPDSRLLGLDADPEAIQAARERLKPYGSRVVLVNANFSALGETAAAQGFAAVDGVLLDLGFSSAQMDTPGRGFSFQRDEPLDMRFGPQGQTAADLVNTLSERELADLIYGYGEEPAARAIARAIVAKRPIRTTGELARLIEGIAGGRGKIHPATRTFQSLRIAVNSELEVLAQVLPQAVALLKPAGRLAIISFHSLEDRLVKRYFQQEAKDCLCPPRLPVCTCGHKASLKVITSKVIVPSDEELRQNPRSRSAKLRIAEKGGS